MSSANYTFNTSYANCKICNAAHSKCSVWFHYENGHLQYIVLQEGRWVIEKTTTAPEKQDEFYCYECFLSL